MKVKFTILSIAVVFLAKAQLPEDAIKASWFTGNGTARTMAVGGVMGSLGGDITAAHVNPAGIGFYRTNEWVMSAGFNNRNNAFNYRGTDTQYLRNAFQYGTTGVVWGNVGNHHREGWINSAVSLSVNQLASYRNNTSFSGFNNMSSFSEQYLEELTRDGANEDAALSNYIFGSSLAFRTYLVDTLNNPNGSLAGYKSLVPISTGVNQFYQSQTRGGMHEVALAFGSNYLDKWYVGGSIVIPIINYRREVTYRETDASGLVNNNFAEFTYQESFQSTGIGFGAKLGAIYKPADRIRLGFALHTPQLITMKDKIRSSMVTNTEGYAGIKTESSDVLNDGRAGEREYTLLTPWRAIASASYVFREVADTRKQRAFISADVEYVNYRGSRFLPLDEADFVTENYLRSLNDVVKQYYRGNLNVRVGAELKLHVWMFRVGGAYFGSPYREEALPGNRWLASGGFGYRNNGYFIDLAYVHSFIKDHAFAYRLADKPNTFAMQNGSNGQISLTFGVKF